ncbi:hypothetical protein [Streptomyces virginiae]|uniref:hypothetical protein n=1 Tax=Streptomyces virginiae TaxID=1961 RepID=UPI0030E18D80
MADPFQEIALGGGTTADLFLLRYSEDGSLLSVEAENEVRQRLAVSSDVFLFSHGWNNIFDQALDRYRGFIAGYGEQGQESPSATRSPRRWRWPLGWCTSPVSRTSTP